ncbi:MAG: glycosyltransferase [Bacteroidota bacterium]|nr:glycosyltransferase [Bacteroidota bacterium]
MPKVSVVVANYNYARFIRDCIESVFNQTYENWELIIVDDGSDDDSKFIIGDIIAQYHDTYDVRAIFKKNSGHPAITFNEGIKESKGEYILCLSSDDIISQNILSDFVYILDNFPEFDFVYCDRVDIDEDGNVIGLVKSHTFLPGKLIFENFISYCSMFKKRIWEDIGGFKVCGFEDWNFWVEALRKGYYGYYLAKPLFYYRRHQKSLFHNQMLNYYSNLSFIFKHNFYLYEPRFLKSVENDVLTSSVNAPKYPLFSVIVPTYNRPDLLREALHSIQWQTIANFEVIIINDGGNSVKDVIEELRDERFKYIETKSRNGLAAARNLGIMYSSGKYITFLDDDDIFLPNHLSTLLRELEKGFKVVYSDSFRYVWNIFNGKEQIVDIKIPYRFDFDRDRLIIGNIAPVNCFAVDREFLVQHGLFNEDFHVLEDWDLWIRLSEKENFKHISVPTAVVNWRSNISGLTNTCAEEFARTREIIYKRSLEDIQKIEKDKIKKILYDFENIWSRDFVSSDGPLTSIIVLAHNNLSYTRQCIKAILSYTHPISYELIVVDNGSTDDTPQFMRLLAERHPEVRYIRLEENLGFAAGNNIGMAAARGRFLVLLNNDVVVTPGWLERLLLPAVADPQVGLVGPVTNRISGRQRLDAVPYDEESLEGLEAFAAERARWYAGRTVEVARLVGFCLLIRPELVERIGGLDTRFGIGNFEDDDYCLRARRAGFKAVMALDCFVHHHGSKTFQQLPIDYGALLLENWEKFKHKWGLPAELPYGELFPEPNDPFDPKRDYVPLTSPKRTLAGWVALTQEALKRNDLAMARQAAIEAIREHPDQPYAWLLEAVLARTEGRYGRALEAIERALSIQETPEALEELARICQAAGEPERAAEVLRYRAVRYPD